VSEAGGTRARLDAQRQAAADRLAGLDREFEGIVAAASSANGDDEHDPEGATIAFERQHVAALLVQAREQIRQLDAARQRLNDGSYGICRQCGRPIGAARLDARPAADTCITCAGHQGSRRSG
jgi:DnaK suppressor protein